jgi:outer membrane biogenesis lipoprotein LolB
VTHILAALALALLAGCTDPGPRSDGLSEAYDIVRETERGR